MSCNDGSLERESKAIDRFDGEYRFLSNFYIEPDGTHVEDEYQSAKTDPPAVELRTMFPGAAKRAGRKLKLRDDWDSVKVQVMADLVFWKFQNHPELLEKLIATGDEELVEGNNWGDMFWGACGGRGLNHLGRILMQVRASNKAAAEFKASPGEGERGGEDYNGGREAT